MKETNLANTSFVHRIIVPIYIPNAEGYFKNVFEVLKLSIESLLQTIHSATAITVINNACSIEVSNYLQKLLNENRIDQLVINANNKGKVDPIVSIMKGSLEPLITITDADVLFRYGWQQEVENVFFSIPNVGMVSPLPQPAQFKYYSTWSWYFALTRNCFTLKGNEDLDAVKKFRESTTDFAGFSEIERKPLGISYNGIDVIIGAGHFCATYNKAVTNKIPNRLSGNQFTGAEVLFLDKPIEDAGLLRLATNKGWVYHMGNVSENWMHDVVRDNQAKKKMEPIETNKYQFNATGFSFRFGILNRIIKKSLNSTRVKNLVFAMAKK